MSVDSTLPPADLAAYVLGQIGVFFPDGRTLSPEVVEPVVRQALHRFGHSLCHSIWYSKRVGPAGRRPVFNHLYSDQYALLLVYLANSAAKTELPGWFTDKVYCLNKALHGIDIGAHVAIPAVFQITHGLGTVIGRASLSDYLMVYQGCTIGGSPDLNYPEIGSGVILYAGARVIGASKIGNNVILSAGAQVIDQTVPDNSVVFGQSRALIIKPLTRDVTAEFFCPAGVP